MKKGKNRTVSTGRTIFGATSTISLSPRGIWVRVLIRNATLNSTGATHSGRCYDNPPPARATLSTTSHRIAIGLPMRLWVALRGVYPCRRRRPRRGATLLATPGRRKAATCRIRFRRKTGEAGLLVMQRPGSMQPKPAIRYAANTWRRRIDTWTTETSTDEPVEKQRSAVMLMR
jgi:hypothetical protein